MCKLQRGQLSGKGEGSIECNYYMEVVFKLGIKSLTWARSSTFFETESVGSCSWCFDRKTDCYTVHRRKGHRAEFRVLVVNWLSLLEWPGQMISVLYEQQWPVYSWHLIPASNSAPQKFAWASQYATLTDRLTCYHDDMLSWCIWKSVTHIYLAINMTRYLINIKKGNWVPC